MSQLIAARDLAFDALSQIWGIAFVAIAAVLIGIAVRRARGLPHSADDAYGDMIGVVNCVMLAAALIGLLDFESLKRLAYVNQKS